MPKTLHILTKARDTLAQKLISNERALPHIEPSHQIDVVDLTHGTPNYDDLIEKIFAADSVAVW